MTHATDKMMDAGVKAAQGARLDIQGRPGHTLVRAVWDAMIAAMEGSLARTITVDLRTAGVPEVAALITFRAQLDALTLEEGASVTLLCQDPESGQVGVDVCGPSTNWIERRFLADTLEGAVAAAYEAANP